MYFRTFNQKISKLELPGTPGLGFISVQKVKGGGHTTISLDCYTYLTFNTLYFCSLGGATVCC